LTTPWSTVYPRRHRQLTGQSGKLS
jgi:hypothetical protein